MSVFSIISCSCFNFTFCFLRDYSIYTSSQRKLVCFWLQGKPRENFLKAKLFPQQLIPIVPEMSRAQIWLSLSSCLCSCRCTAQQRSITRLCVESLWKVYPITQQVYYILIRNLWTIQPEGLLLLLLLFSRPQIHLEHLCFCEKRLRSFEALYTSTLFMFRVLGSLRGPLVAKYLKQSM